MELKHKIVRLTVAGKSEAFETNEVEPVAEFIMDVTTEARKYYLKYIKLSFHLLLHPSFVSFINLITFIILLVA